MLSENRTGKTLIVHARFVPRGSRASGTPVLPGIAVIEHDHGDGVRIEVDGASVFIDNQELADQQMTIT